MHGQEHDVSGETVSGAGDLAARLRVVIESIDEMAFDVLRSASADGRVPVADRRLMQARRAVEKAERILTELSE